MSLPTRVPRDSYDPSEVAQRDFDQFFSRWLGGQGENGVLAPYGVDVREDADHIYVEAELPGFKKEHVNITLENNTLTISAQRESKHEQGNGKGQLLLHERRYTRFQRSFTLPPTVDEQSVNAKLDSGVLTITLNKREETKPRKISVS